MKLLNHIPAWLKNKYFIVSLAFIAWVTFFDSKDLLTQAQRRQELNDLQVSKEHFTKQINAGRKELNQLQSNPAALEKYAREKYHMKRDNEDLFLIPSEGPGPEN
jgi:cell division protein DivIC